MEGSLSPRWQDPVEHPGFPSGTCADGTRVQGYYRTAWFDAGARLARFRRRIVVTPRDGEPVEHEYEQLKHPVSTGEVREWLEAAGMTVLQHYGARDGTAYHDAAPKTIFWAQRPA